MTVTEIQITKLKEYENNPRHNEGVPEFHISQACKNQYGRKTAGGFTWNYAE